MHYPMYTRSHIKALNLECYVFFREVFNTLKERIHLVLTAFLNTSPTFSITT